MAQTTITEALAEIKTIDKRIAKQTEFVKNYIARPDMVRDPLEKEGGCVVAVAAALQSISDLEERKVALRSAINTANATNSIAIGKQSRTIAEWIIWRREVSKGRSDRLSQIINHVLAVRNDAQKRGLSVVGAGTAPSQPTDIIVNVNESDLNARREELETILGTLDGQLSLKNATVLVTIPN